MMPLYEVTGGFWVDPRDQSKRHWKGETVDVSETVASPAVELGILTEPEPEEAEKVAETEPESAEPVKRGPGRPRTKQ